MSTIHPTAQIDSAARLGRDVSVGPFCVIGPDVELGAGCKLHNNVTILGPTTIGPGNTFFPYCVIGGAPQDLKYKGGPTRLQVGGDNQFREFVTIHRGTEVDRSSGGLTRIGDRNLLMVGVHVAHDCEIGNHTIIANNVMLAGHVRIEDCVNVGGGAAMHHFVTIGRLAFIGGLTRVTHDAPPYMKVVGYDGMVRAINSQGLRRWQVSDESQLNLKRAFRLLYARQGERSAGRLSQALEQIEANGLKQDPHVAYLADFLRHKLEMGVFGRARECQRTDTPADRAGFYAAACAEVRS